MGKAGQSMRVWSEDHKNRRRAGLKDFRDTSPTESEEEEEEGE